MASSTPKKADVKSVIWVVAEQERCQKWQSEGDIEILSSGETLEGFLLHASFEWVSQDKPIWTIFEETEKASEKVKVARIRLTQAAIDRPDSPISNFLTGPAASNFPFTDTRHGRVLLAPLPPAPKVTTKRNHQSAANRQSDYRIPIPEGDFDAAEKAIAAQLSLTLNYRHLSPAGGFISLDTVAQQLTKDTFCSTFQWPDSSNSLGDAVTSFQTRIQNALIVVGLIKMKKADGKLDSTCMMAVKQFQLDFNTKPEPLRLTSLLEYFKAVPSEAPPNLDLSSAESSRGSLTNIVRTLSSLPSTPTSAAQSSSINAALQLRMEGLIDCKTASALFGYVTELKALLDGIGFVTPSDPFKTPRRFKSIFKAIRSAMDESELSEALMSATSLPIGGLPPLSSIPRFFEPFGCAHRQSVEYGKMVPPNLKDGLQRIIQAAAAFKPKDKKRTQRRSGERQSPAKSSNSVPNSTPSTPGPSSTTSNTATPNSSNSPASLSLTRIQSPSVAITNPKRRSAEMSPHHGNNSALLNPSPSSPTISSTPPSFSPIPPSKVNTVDIQSSPRTVEAALAAIGLKDENASSPKGTPRKKGHPLTRSSGTPLDSPRRATTSPGIGRKVPASSSSKDDTLHLPNLAAGVKGALTAEYQPHHHHNHHHNNSHHPTSEHLETVTDAEKQSQTPVDNPSLVFIVFDREFHRSVPHWESQIEIVDSEVILQGYRLWVNPSRALSRSQPGWALTRGDPTDCVTGMAVRRNVRYSTSLTLDTATYSLWDYYTRAKERNEDAQQHPPATFDTVVLSQGSLNVEHTSDLLGAESKLVRCPDGKLNPHISRIRILATLARLGCTAKDFEYSLTYGNVRSQDQFYLKYKMDRETPIGDALHHVVRNTQVCLVALNYMKLPLLSPWYSNHVSEAVIRFEKEYEQVHDAPPGGKKNPVPPGGTMTFVIYDELVNQTRLFHRALIKLGFPVKCTPFEDISLFATFTNSYIETQKTLNAAPSHTTSHQSSQTPQNASSSSSSPSFFCPMQAKLVQADLGKHAVFSLPKLLHNPIPIPSNLTDETPSKAPVISPRSMQGDGQSREKILVGSAHVPDPQKPHTRPQISKDDSSIRREPLGLNSTPTSIAPSASAQPQSNEIEFGSSLATKYKEVLMQHEELQERYHSLEESFLELSNDAAEANTSLQFFEEQYKESVQHYDVLTKEYEALKRAAEERDASAGELVQNVATLEAKLQKLARIAQRSFTTQLLWYLILLLLYILLLPALGITFLIDLWRQKRNGLELTEENSIRARMQRYSRHQLTKLERVIDDLERRVNTLMGMEQMEKPS